MAAACYLACLLALSATCGVKAFNLEPRIPVIKNGEHGSFFGYSVALHQSKEKRYDGTEEQRSWLLVGAPLDQNLQPNTSRSGALWKCPLSTRSKDCKQVVTDGYRGSYRNLHPPSNRELKDGQWMGVTVRSQGPEKKVLVCAHRYIERGEDNDYHWGNGLCYTLKQDLKFDAAWQPCLNMDTSRAHEQYGYCQAGTSGILTDDDSALLGLPGPYTWRGTVFHANISDDFLDRDKTQYFGPVTESTSPVDKYSYLGMAVTYGRFFPSGDKSMVAGAPRSEGTGQVVFFSKEKIGQKTLQYDLILDGELFASQFGYELCSLDFNSDGMTDLVVGAPFHFTDTTGGAIYIYKTPRDGLSRDTERIRLTGKPESRFGFALANLGDLNKDGYEDLAVGAPFEGMGVVYIYLGGRNGLGTEPVQVIRSEDVVGANVPMTFGYALGGGDDIDGNGYPDLLIGSFCNDTVALIRARPIVGIVTRVKGLADLENINPTDPSCDAVPGSTEKCVVFEACFKMESLDQLRTNVYLEYRLEAETFQPGRKFSRVRFLDGLPDSSHIVEKTIPLSDQNTREFLCTQGVMFVKRQTRDIQTPIPLKLTYQLKQRTPKPSYPGAELPDIAAFPILNQQQASKTFYAKFIKNCGRDDICQSDLLVKPEFDLGKDENGYPVLELGPERELRVNVTTLNRAEPAYDARLFVTHPQHVSFVRKEPPRDNVFCTTLDAGTVVCYLGNPLLKGPSEMVLVFDVRQLDDDDSQLELAFSSNTTSEDVGPRAEKVIRARVAKRSELSVSGVARPEQSFYGGEVRGEAVMEYLDEVGSSVFHTYEVYNDGPSTVDYVDVHIEWPAQVQSGGEEGKWLLYMTRPPVVEGDGECFLDKTLVNPLNLKQRPGVEDTRALAGYRRGSGSTIKTSGSTSTGGSISTSTFRNSSSSSTSHSSVTTGGATITTGGSRDHHDRVVVEDTTVRKTDTSSGLNTVESRQRKPDDGYRRKRPLDGGFSNREYNYERTQSGGRTLSRVDGDKEDDYFLSGPPGGRGGSYSETSRTYQTSQNGAGAGGARDGGSFSETRRTYQTSQSGAGAGGARDGGSFSETRRTYQTSQSGAGAGGARDGGSDDRRNFQRGRYDSRNDELERRYGSGQGFRTIGFDGGAEEDSGSAGGRFDGSVQSGRNYSYSSSGGGRRRLYGPGRDYGAGGDEYDGEGDGGAPPRRPGRRRGYFRRRRPRPNPDGTLAAGGGGGGNQSYVYRRRYNARRPIAATDLNGNDLEARRDELSGRRVAGGTERVENIDGGTRRQYSAERRLNGGFESEEISEEERRWRREREEEARRQRREWGADSEGRSKRAADEPVLRRRRREQEMVVMPEAVTSQSGEVQQVVYMDCERGSAKCIKFRCRIYKLPENKYALVQVEGRIWNSTLVEDYADVDYVSIKSRATLGMDPDLEKLQDITDDVATAESVAYPDLPRAAEDGGVPIWVIIVSVLAGLLLLAIIALILWKLGFFKRRRPDPTLKSNISR